MALPSMCACYVDGGMIGDTCTEFTNWGIALFVVYAICIALCCVIICISIQDFIISRRGIYRRPFTAFSTTLVFNLVASISLAAYAAVFLAAAFEAGMLPLEFVFLVITFVFLRYAIRNSKMKLFTNDSLIN